MCGARSIAMDWADQGCGLNQTGRQAKGKKRKGPEEGTSGEGKKATQGGLKPKSKTAEAGGGGGDGAAAASVSIPHLSDIITCALREECLRV